MKNEEIDILETFASSMDCTEQGFGGFRNDLAFLMAIFMQSDNIQTLDKSKIANISLTYQMILEHIEEVQTWYLEHIKKV